MNTLSPTSIVVKQKQISTILPNNNYQQVAFKAQTADCFTPSNTQKAEISFCGIFNHFNKENRTIRALGVKDSIEKVLNGNMQEFDNLQTLLNEAKPPQAKIVRDYLVKRITSNQHNLKRIDKNTLLVKLDHVPELASKIITQEGARQHTLENLEGQVLPIPLIHSIQINLHNSGVDINNMTDLLKDLKTQEFCPLSDLAKEQIKETAIDYLDKSRFNSNQDNKYYRNIAIGLLSYGKTNDTLVYLENIADRDLEPLTNRIKAFQMIPIVYSHISEPDKTSEEILLKTFVAQLKIATSTMVYNKDTRAELLKSLSDIAKLTNKTIPNTTKKIAQAGLKKIQSFVNIAKLNPNLVSLEVLDALNKTINDLKTYTDSTES